MDTTTLEMIFVGKVCFALLFIYNCILIQYNNTKDFSM